MRQMITEMLSKYPRLYQPLKTMGRVLRQRPIQRRIVRHLQQKNSVFFVQIGSNDGLQGDPLHDLIVRNTTWKGMFVEPVPFLFERLIRNHGHSERFIFENMAIAASRGKTKFYYVSEEAKAELGDRLPAWHDQLGSFDRHHILKHLQGRLEPYIVEEEVETITLQELFDKNNIEAIDLLHIDTEGFDYQVLSQVDFSRYRPCVVLYEHKHLSDDEKNLAESLLREYRYRCVRYDGGDTIAFLES